MIKLQQIEYLKIFEKFRKSITFQIFSQISRFICQNDGNVKFYHLKITSD